MLRQFQKLDLLENKNDDEHTPLQLAIMCHNAYLVTILLKFSTSIANVDSESNTALHVAVKSSVGKEILDTLLQDRPLEKIATYIDSKNNGKSLVYFLFNLEFVKYTAN